MSGLRGLTFVVGNAFLATAAGCDRAYEEFSGDCPPDPKTCDGRCVAVDDPAYGCGPESCTPCAITHGVAMCVSGACALGGCTAGFDDCDGQPDNGCETPVDTVERCGACDTSCVLAEATPACVDGQCAVASCEDGFEDCDDDPANGCEADLASDEHCGVCGYDCLGGGCGLREGALDCGDVKLYTGADAAEVLGIAVDDAHVYFATFDGRLLRIPKDVVEVDPLGLEVETIIAAGVGLDVAVDDDFVYWSTFGGSPGLYRAAKVPDATPELVQGTFSVDDATAGLARRGDFLYWANLVGTAQAGVWRVDLSNLGSPSNEAFVTACDGPCAFVADADVSDAFVCWTQVDASAQQVNCRATSGGNITTRPEASPRFVAVEGDRVYWTSSVSSGALRTAQAVGLQVDADLLTGLNQPTGVAYDASSIYIGELNGKTIRRRVKRPE